MKKTNTFITIILAMVMVVAMFAGVLLGTTKVSYADSVATNDGRTTDFVDYWWGGAAMSSVLNNEDETVITLPNTDFGHRMNNGKDVNGTGTDIYTAEIDFTMTTGLLSFFAFAHSEDQFLNARSIAICLKKGEEKNPNVVTVGKSHEEFDKDANDSTCSWEINTVENVHFNIKNEKIANDGGLKMTVTVNSTPHEIIYTEAQLDARFGAGVRTVDEVFGGWKSVSTITVHNYTDSYREAYLNSVETEFDSVVTSLNAIDVSGVNTDTSIDDLVAIQNPLTQTKATIASMNNLRLREKGVLSNKIGKIEKTLSTAIGDNEAKQKMVTVVANVNVFVDAVNAGVNTKAKAEAAEALKMAVSLDDLNELVDDATYGTLATTKKTEYTTARNKLANEKDKLVLADVVAFETAVKDLSTNEKMLAAGDAKNAIILSNAFADNQDSYAERVNVAAKLLNKALNSYAGDLAKSWDIYNVTFMKANENGGIDYASTDYYDDDPATDVGISFRDKFQLDGFSINVTFEEGNIGANVWLGIHFFSDLDVMHISDTDDFKASLGITNLILPREESTTFAMGYPKLYGNCPAGDWPVVSGAFLGNTMNLRFAKNADGSLYEAYVKMGDADEVLLRTMDASVLETYLENGEGYLNIGACDKDLSTIKMTINTINGKDAASYVAKNVKGDETVKPSDEQKTPDDTTPVQPVEEKKSGCGSSIEGFSIVGTLMVLVATVVVIRAKKENN